MPLPPNHPYLPPYSPRPHPHATNAMPNRGIAGQAMAMTLQSAGRGGGLDDDSIESQDSLGDGTASPRRSSHGDGEGGGGCGGGGMASAVGRTLSGGGSETDGVEKFSQIEEDRRARQRQVERTGVRLTRVSFLSFQLLYHVC